MQGTAGLSIDTALRIVQLAETRARRYAWHARQDRLLRDPASAHAEPVAVERPRPLPDGPVEHYAPRTAGVAGAGAGVALLAGGGPRRAAAIAVPCCRRPPVLAGRARELPWTTAGPAGCPGHGPAGTARLERIDTVVLDAPALTTGVT